MPIDISLDKSPLSTRIPSEKVIISSKLRNPFLDSILQLFLYLYLIFYEVQGYPL